MRDIAEMKCHALSSRLHHERSRLVGFMLDAR